MIDFILNPRVAIWAGVILAIATPVAGAGVYVWRRKASPTLARYPLFWILSALGPLLAVLWMLFNAIENFLGLDSALALGLNLTVFSLIGIGLGAAVRYGSPAGETDSSSS